MIHINLNTVSCTHVEHSPTKIIYTKYYMETHTHTHSDYSRNWYYLGNTVRSCGSEFQIWAQSKRKCESHETCVYIAGFSACGYQKKSVVYEMDFKRQNNTTLTGEKSLNGDFLFFIF